MDAPYKPLLLITGASGHLGFRVLVLALQAGYRARIALRKPEQAERIKNSPSARPYTADIEAVQVPDVIATGAYDEAVKGVQHIIHIASPMPTKLEHQKEDWQELYFEPATKGTLSILAAAAKSPSVKTVIITSSVGILRVPESKDRAGPNDLIPRPSVEAASKLETPGEAYIMSKVLAHHAGTEFVSQNEVGYSLIRILPGLIQGPHELAQNVGDLFASSSIGTLNAMLGHPTRAANSQVLLDDAARAHVLALDPEKGRNGDVIIVVGNDGNCTAWDVYARNAAKFFPREVESGLFKPGTVGKVEQSLKKYEVASSEEVLGFKFAGLDEMARGVLEQYLELRRQS
ncbi:hypothetical protein M409DRAFT_25249 [Zasmidium cellare ATCC 36951]|uniref:NAD-dependent epimerase/dehydratase domain-containing protein n=1 Tax=Zasmidium cellare ATCC 36951 TaxID=1080233 RepID=A0A6A6CDS0_ZASCE|nr:uncharacterized protein M409DRAFT_25249 [Zasmidium cellare ATCC 36951]KAF2164370.1 hypothetical protein M409DRAFT_25249 [Zasmidium cellare ATCC 36951]